MNRTCMGITTCLLALTIGVAPAASQNKQRPVTQKQEHRTQAEERAEASRKAHAKRLEERDKRLVAWKAEGERLGKKSSAQRGEFRSVRDARKKAYKDARAEYKAQLMAAHEKMLEAQEEG